MGAEFDAYWNIDPLGNEVGYCCFSAALRDWARLGLLLADGGARDGKQIIPADWVRAATSSQAPYPGYGYQTWVSSLGDRFHLRGLRGQAVVGASRYPHGRSSHLGLPHRRVGGRRYAGALLR